MTNFQTHVVDELWGSSFELRYCFIGSVVGIFSGCWIMSPIFTLYKPDFECLTSFETDYLQNSTNNTAENYIGLRQLFQVPGDKCEVKTGNYRSCMNQTDPTDCITGALTQQSKVGLRNNDK